jgi:hypothetical protein
MEKKILSLSFLVAIFLAPSLSFGFSVIRNISMPVTGDFVLRPAKLEFDLTNVRNEHKDLVVTNRSGLPMQFSVDLEDSNNQNEVTKISKYVFVDNKNFILQHGEEAHIKISALVPISNTEKFISGVIMVSGGLFDRATSDESRVITRAGTLVFLDIGKIAVRNGEVKTFTYDKNGRFLVEFSNTGESKLNPYGFIIIKDIFGRIVEEIKIDPWFVLPDSNRINEINWSAPNFLQPMYKAQLVLYPGFGDAEKTENKFVFIYNFISIFVYFVLLFLLIIMFKKIFKK